MASYATNEEKLTSEFNEAGFQISRLHNIKLACAHLRTSGKIVPYKWQLQSYEIEMGFDAKRLDEDIKKDEEKFLNRLKKLNEEGSTAEKEGNRSVVFQKLVEKEILLKEIQELAGKGARYRPVDDDYM